MNKYIKKLLVLAMTAAMVLSMGVAAYADGGDPGGGGGSSSTAPQTDRDNDSKLTKDREGSGGTPESYEIEQDTDFIYLIKDYNIVSSGANAKSPEEEITITITPLGVANVGTIVTEAPVLGNASTDGITDKVTFNGAQVATATVEVNSSTNTVIKIHHVESTTEKQYKVKLSLPIYTTTGDYWYTVTEASKATTGVNYATNADTPLTYYIHVQVVNGTPTLKRSVTLHTDGPTKNDLLTDLKYAAWVEGTSKDYANYTSNKENDIQNSYSAGSLSIHKEVTGNAGETAKRFEVTVVFTKPKDTIITSNITYSAVNAENGTETANTIYNQTDTTAGHNKWQTIPASETDSPEQEEATPTAALTNTVVFFIKNGETVKFDNIPFGVTYTVTETDPEDGHINKISFTDKHSSDSDTIDDADSIKISENRDENFAKYADGKIDDALDAIEIENHKEIPIDVGVILENAPYVAILLIAAAAVVVFARRRKVSEEY